MFLAASFEKVSASFRGGVDVFLFDHVCDLRGDGRGLASACACKDQLEGLGVFYGEELAGYFREKRRESNGIGITAIF